MSKQLAGNNRVCAGRSSVDSSFIYDEVGGIERYGEMGSGLAVAQFSVHGLYQGRLTFMKSAVIVFMQNAKFPDKSSQQA